VSERPEASAAGDLWSAAALAKRNPAAGRAALESCFRSGTLPASIEGPTRGRVLATTMGHGLDRPFGVLASAWMPWKGKTFRPSDAEGRNVFTNDSKLLVRVIWPRYHGLRPIGSGRYTAFRFVTHTGPSVMFPDRSVLRIDYDISDDPRFLIRRILDEVVEVSPGALLGQALLRLRGRWRRAAWFSLEP
jgi:hypothetical protein